MIDWRAGLTTAEMPASVLTTLFRFLVTALAALPRSSIASNSAIKESVRLENAANTVYFYDLRYTAKLSPDDAFEHMHLLAALSGLVNREEPKLYTNLTDSDSTWKEYLTQSGEWLAGTTFIPTANVSSLVNSFKSYIKGVVLYDPNVHATSNVASTASGVYDLLPVCYRPDNPTSLYNALVIGGPRLSVVVNLVGRFNGSVTGSAKCDAYVWAKQQFIDTHLCDASFMGYYVDYFAAGAASSSNYMLSKVPNHDYFIAHKGFFFDLDVWGDEAPNDDPSQPVGTDRTTLLLILQAAYDQTGGSKMIHIGGFTPWFFKYVDSHSQHAHGGVATEWETVKVVTAFNAFVDADACCIGVMANAALYQHYPLPVHLTQNPIPTIAQLQQKGYIDAAGKVVEKNYCMFYAGDYDSAAWLYSQLKKNWEDPHRGQVPIGWAIDPGLSLRFPPIFPLLFSSRSPLDFFIAGDSGAGYLNPTQLIPPRQVSNIAASAADLWEAFNRPLFDRFDLNFTGFIIQGVSGQMTSAAEDIYLGFSPLGIVLTPTADPDPTNVHLHNTSMPVFHHVSDLPGDVDKAVDTVTGYTTTGTKFYVFRTILQSATFHYQVAAQVKERESQMEFVDPYTLSILAQVFLKDTISLSGKTV